MNSLTISANNLIDCNSNILMNGKCIENFNIIKNIYANKEFGICFELEDKNRTIFLKDNNYIEFSLNNKIQHNILYLAYIPRVNFNKGNLNFFVSWLEFVQVVVHCVLILTVKVNIFNIATMGKKLNFEKLSTPAQS